VNKLKTKAHQKARDGARDCPRDEPATNIERNLALTGAIGNGLLRRLCADDDQPAGVNVLEDRWTRQRVAAAISLCSQFP
jgi:hypothetical protein